MAFPRFVAAPRLLKHYSIATVQVLCFVHLFNEHVAEIRIVRLGYCLPLSCTDNGITTYRLRADLWNPL